MKGLPRDTGGAVILEGLSQSKQKEKQVKKAAGKLLKVQLAFSGLDLGFGSLRKQHVIVWGKYKHSVTPNKR